MNWTEYVLFSITAIGVMFAIYRSYREPDIKADKEISLISLRMDSLERKLSNDLPHMDAKINDIHKDISEMRQSLVRLSTIIEERIPK